MVTSSREGQASWIRATASTTCPRASMCRTAHVSARGSPLLPPRLRPLVLAAAPGSGSVCAGCGHPRYETRARVVWHGDGHGAQLAERGAHGPKGAVQRTHIVRPRLRL
jgi:hypothetical protein